jgi:ubiquitin C-terminal hydrolase
MKKAKEVYSIDDVLANTVSNNYHICKTIATKLDEFENWQNGLQYHCTHFIQIRGNSYMNAFYQCLSHIPALTRIILETNIFDNILDTIKSPLSQYIEQLMKNNKILVDDSLDPFAINGEPILYDNYELISSDQRSGLDFIFSCIAQFTDSCPIFELTSHHLFEFYYTQKTYCMDPSHCFSHRKRLDILDIAYDDESEYQSKNLSTIIDIIFSRDEQLDYYHCLYCLDKKPGKGRTTSRFHTFPRVLLVCINRGGRGNNNDYDIEFSRYLKLQGDQGNVVQFQLIGTIVYYNETFIS